MMMIQNTEANRQAILEMIRKDGVNLAEFSKEQKQKIILHYAARFFGAK